MRPYTLHGGSTSRALVHSASSSRATSNKFRCQATLAYQVTSRDTDLLTPEQINRFHEDGFLVLENFASPEEVAAVKARAVELAEEFDPASISVFSTRNQMGKSDQYFLDSASNISCFLEEKAMDKETGQLKQAKHLSINKIGHALHDLDPVFRAFSRSPKVSAVVRSLGYKRPLPVQSMYIFKQPSIGGEVVPHQDSTFLNTQPLSCTGLWWALEDATRDNGCLWAQPAVHKRGLLRRFYVNEDKVLSFDRPAPSYDLSACVPLEVPAGTLVLLHGENIHYSCENTSPTSRHSYSMHVVESAPGTVWTDDNWAHRRPDVPWTPLYDVDHPEGHR